MVCSVVSYLVNAAWEIPLLALAGWAVSRLQKSIGPKAQHATWVMTLALAVFTPALSLWSTLPIFSHASAQDLTIAISVAQNFSVIENNSAILPAAAILVIFCAYVCVLFYFSARFLWSLVWTFKLMREAHPVALTASQDAIWNRCKQAFSLQHRSQLPGG